ncbi:MAG TPA: 1-(5-phosphoribosyl)-5-[(5-phosphoribosylamino)methylideneamino] imidazole-4-carboxamide isomerase [Xanthomonadales bacterium]|nr:1-(5-phosphoribosyl)-5-[(5-phosphoribosylamino)methylideneamino] imidazole-4-carboxamide isomerase [Xanthomonadales bacterium]
MYLIPAIDLLDGKCVRLRQGDFQQVTYYKKPSLTVAEEYAQAGAGWLHLVDLAASRDGTSASANQMFQILQSVSQRVQTGGGVRDTGDVEARLAAGASRVVVGSVAAESPDTFCRWLGWFGPDSLVAALDVKYDDNGVPRVKSQGWTRDSGRDLWSLLDQLADTRLKHLLCTDIGRDGLLNGPNLDLYREINHRYPDIEIQASGGIRDIPDLEALAATGAAAAISGKALLDGKYSVKDALAALERAR